MIKNKDTNFFLEKYKNLPKADKNRVIISFYLDKNDLDSKKLKNFINSILDQTVRVDEIALYVNSKYASKIPKFLEKIVSIYPQTKVYKQKSISSIIPTILTEPSINTKIIIIEPDFYEKDFLENFIDNFKKEKESKILKCKRNIIFKTDFFANDISDCQTLEELFKKSSAKIISM